MAVKSTKPTTRNTKVVEVAWGSVELQMVPKTFTPMLPPLPYKQWMEVCSFLKFCQTDRQGEGIVSLTLIKKKWHVICWHQESIGMHVKYEEGSEENQTLLTDELREALDNIHCTVHSHYTAGAFQSGDDKDDELQKIGWHVTVGQMNKTKMDSHARWNLNKPARREGGVKVENSIQSWIEFDAESIVGPFKAPKGYLAHPAAASSHKQNVHITPNNSFFPEEWKARVRKKAYTTSSAYGYKAGPRSAAPRNPMLPLAVSRESGSDYTIMDVNSLTSAEMLEISKMILSDHPFVEVEIKTLMHALAQKVNKNEVYSLETKTRLTIEVMKYIHATVPQVDAEILAKTSANFIAAFLKSEKYTSARFNALFKATYEIEVAEFNELFAKYQEPDAHEVSEAEEVAIAREGLSATMGELAVQGMTDKDVLACFSL